MKISFRVFQAAWLWIERILKLETTRLTRICFERQLKLHRDTNIKITYDWIGQFNDILQKIGLSGIWESMNSESWSSLRNLAFRRYRIYLRFCDLLRCTGSNSMSFKILRTHFDPPAWYLSVRGQYYMIKVFAQLRLSSIHGTYFQIISNQYKINQKQKCLLCNLNAFETIEHILLLCPLYENLRTFYLAPILLELPYEERLRRLFYITDPSDLKMLYFYIAQSLKLRAFVLHE